MYTDSGTTGEVAATQVSEVALERQQTIEAMLHDLNMFAAVVAPEMVIEKFPELHCVMWAMMIEGSKSPKKFLKFALGLPRGHAKSTLMKLFVVYCILFTPISFIVIFGAARELAENILADVLDMLGSPNVVALFGNYRAVMEKETQNLVKFSFRGKNVIMRAAGRGAVRGINLKNKRPDMVIFDDIQDREDAESEIESQKLIKWLLGTAMKLRSPHGCLFLFIGNMFPGAGCILSKLQKNKQWTSFIVGCILEDGKPLWPEVHSLEALLDELENDMLMGHPEIFFSEMMNDRDAGISALFAVDRVPHFLADPSDVPSGGMIIIDPAGQKMDANDTVLGAFYIFDAVPVAWAFRWGCLSPLDTIKEALRMAFELRIPLIAVESVAYQASLLFWFNWFAEKMNLTGVQIVPLSPKGVKKTKRIVNGFKELLSGTVKLHDAVRGVVLDQAKKYNPTLRDNEDDIVDVVAYAPQVMQEFGNLAIMPWTAQYQEISEASGSADDSTLPF